MLIAKHFDPVLGIDIHILVTPAGPIPIPHPHIALILDPIDYIPVFNLGASVWVGGIPRAGAGTAGMPIPHFPLGGSFVKPPMNENEIFMGSTTVLADGAPLSFTALPALSCHDIGILAPIRAKKPKKSYGMVLPTSVLLSIPVGMPVLVGGPPTVDMMALAMRGGMAALGGAFKKLRKLQKKSKRIKKVSEAVHKRASKAMDKLGVPANIRNKIHKGICTVTGHPVDVASGKMFTDHIDFELPGPLPLVWERTWYSTSVYDGPLGHGWHHTYDVKLCEMDNAVAVRLADGRSVAFPALKIDETCFDRAERLTLIKDISGYALDTSEGLRYRFTPFNNHPDNQLLATLTQKSSGARIDFQYNGDGLLQQIIDSGGRFIRLTYTEEKRVHKIYLPDPQPNATRSHVEQDFFCAIEHHYRNGMLVTVKDALQQPLQYHYDHKLLIKETFRNGLSFYFEYDALDHNARCVKTWGDEGIYFRHLHYDKVNNITYVKDSLGHVTIYHHNGVLPHKIIDPLKNANQVEYNQYSQVICATSPLGYKTRYEYDDFGSTTKIIHADDSTTHMSYDQHRNLIEVIDSLGSSWRYEYNRFNRIVTKINPLNQKTSYEYADTTLSKMTDAGGSTFHFRYDQNLNMRSIAEMDGVQAQWEYDALGNVLASRDDRGNQRRFHRDILGRIIQIEEPDGNIRHITYDMANNVVRAKDQQYDVSFTYQGMGRLSSSSQGSNTLELQYDKEERLIRIVNEQGGAYQIKLDANGEIIVEVGFDGLIRQYLRDADNRVIRINRPGGRHTTYSYDVMGRPTQIIHSDGAHENFTYRADGELIRAENDCAKLNFERDLLGRVTKEINGDVWVSSAYNDKGLRTRIQSSLGIDQKISRNQRGGVEKISTGNEKFETTFQRDNQGMEIQRNLPGGIQSRWIRDGLGRPARHEIHSHQQKSSKKIYFWGVNDRLLKIIDSLQRETQFHHDSLGNLVSARYSDNTFEMRIPDALGNLFKTLPKKDREYGSAGELLATHEHNGSTRYHYDDEGNLCHKIAPSESNWFYEWRGTGMLHKVVRPDGKEVIFKYDALGRRICKTFNGKTTRWIWDGNNPLHEWTEREKTAKVESSFEGSQLKTDKPDVDYRPELLHTPDSQAQFGESSEGNRDTPITWLFEPESFSPIAKLIGETYYSIVTNFLGTPEIMFDENGTQIWSAEISIWGELRNVKGEKQLCPFRWPGQYEDVETGLYYNRFRYYDAAAGQYLSQDPIRLHGGTQFYAYPLDPLTAYDPLGLIIVYRLLRPDEDPLQGLNAKKPGRNMTTHGHVSSGSRNKGSQFISTSTDPAALAPWREPNQRMVSFDTDDVVPDIKGNKNIFDISDVDKAKSHGVGAVSAQMSAKSKEVLVEGHVPPKAIKTCK